MIGINLKISTNDDNEDYVETKIDVDPNKIYMPQNIIIDKSEINTNSNGSDEAGGIMINASDKISLLNGSKILSQGNNGLLLIGINDKILRETFKLVLISLNDIDNPKSVIIDNSEINTDDNGLKKAGNISIDASNQISLINASNISSKGNFGSIFVGDKYTPKSFVIDNKSEINTDGNSSKIAGNITINASDKLSLI
ncbi:hypothetical protein [Nostoc sp. FACHB-133]|uniref:hypothetical protein n=1 Tax=Nostoc sp. FACHB-133 TaxID=2692835 RepID=UPI0016831CED|nr:hypothetical protein [Nostoc sp. FACHB-133]MBD2523089.1 hypothetical protein [Nostoc sp. FACHB-133]